MSDAARRIESILRERFCPLHFALRDDSARHAGHAGATSGGGHFHVTLVSAAFEGRSRLESVGKEQELVERGHLADADARRRQLADVEKSLAERVAERAERLADLGVEVESLYQRVATALGSGVATVRDDRCSGCHRAIPPQTVNLMLAGELHTCSNCQRILVPGEL